MSVSYNALWSPVDDFDNKCRRPCMFMFRMVVI